MLLQILGCHLCLLKHDSLFFAGRSHGQGEVFCSGSEAYGRKWLVAVLPPGYYFSDALFVQSQAPSTTLPVPPRAPDAKPDPPQTKGNV